MAASAPPAAAVIAAASAAVAALAIVAAAVAVSDPAAVAASAAVIAAAVAASAGGGGGFRGGGGGGGGARGGMPAQVIGEGSGVVNSSNGQKGFGFIVRDDGGDDVFVHISAVEQAGLTGLAEGQPLKFTLVDRGGKVSADRAGDRRRASAGSRGRQRATPRSAWRPWRPRRRRRAGPDAAADWREGQRHGQVLQRDERLRLHSAR